MRGGDSIAADQRQIGMEERLPGRDAGDGALQCQLSGFQRNQFLLQRTNGVLGGGIPGHSRPVHLAMKLGAEHLEDIRRRS